MLARRVALLLAVVVVVVVEVVVVEVVVVVVEVVVVEVVLVVVEVVVVEVVVVEVVVVPSRAVTPTTVHWSKRNSSSSAQRARRSPCTWFSVRVRNVLPSNTTSVSELSPLYRQDCGREAR